jgi:hypothetical protein
MVRIALLGLSLIVVGVDAGRAQDIAGIEDCTKTSGLDKRTGCLQSNVNFLQRLVIKNALEARHKPDEAALTTAACTNGGEPGHGSHSGLVEAVLRADGSDARNGSGRNLFSGASLSQSHGGGGDGRWQRGCRQDTGVAGRRFLRQRAGA